MLSVLLSAGTCKYKHLQPTASTACKKAKHRHRASSIITMANATKVVAVLAILVLLQVSCAIGQTYTFSAVMSVNGFDKGEEGGPASCDGQYHSDDQFLVSLGTMWYGPDNRCGKTIRIRSSDEVYVVAMVVDECGRESGCGENEISTSAAVWKAFGLDTGVGEVFVSWSDTN
uniref:Ripening-related protein n=1 Tax=Hordeum vulgare subsp. vulgare TaxID=112509 RepID=A0A8I6YFA1_HORVV